MGCQLALMLCNILVTFYPLKVCVSHLWFLSTTALLPQPKEPCFNWVPARQADPGLELEGITHCTLNDVKVTIIIYLIQNGTRVVHGKFSSPVSEPFVPVFPSAFCGFSYSIVFR